MEFNGPIFRASIILLDPIPLNVYLVKGTNYAVWIDSGVKSMFPRFVETMEQANVAPRDVRFILNTHSHHDHIGSNAQIRQHTNCLIGAPGHYAAWHADFEAHYQQFARPLPDLMPDTPELRAEALNPLDAPSPLDFYIDEGAYFDLGGGVTLTAYNFPGHMLAEVGWFETATRTLILGDAITGIAWPLFHGHLTVSGYRHSLDKIGRLLHELNVQQVICAHYPAMTPAKTQALVAQAHAYIDSIEVCLLRLLATSEQPVTLKILWQETCQRMNRLQEFRSLSMVDAHIADLIERGIVREVSSHTYTLK